MKEDAPWRKFYPEKTKGKKSWSEKNCSLNRVDALRTEQTNRYHLSFCRFLSLDVVDAKILVGLGVQMIVTPYRMIDDATDLFYSKLSAFLGSAKLALPNPAYLTSGRQILTNNQC